MANHLGRSVRQVDRYLKQLADAGLPIVSDDGELEGIAKRWRLDRDGFHGLPSEMPPLGMSFAELFAIVSALKVADLPHCSWVDEARDSAIEKLSVYLPGREGRRLPVIRSGIVSAGPDEARIEELSKTVLEAVVDGVVRDRIVQIHYPWGKGRQRPKLVEPLGIVLAYGGIYGAVRVPPHRDIRFLNLARASRASVTDEEFRPPEGQLLSNFVQSSFALWSDAPQEARIRFRPDAAAAVRVRTIHPSQEIEEQPDGGVILKLRIGGRTELLWWILRWGDSAELLSPESWREELRSMIAKMRDLYA